MFGDLIRQCRTKSGLSITELGAQIGKDASTISRWERGAVCASAEQTMAAIAACGIEPQEGVRLISEALMLAYCHGEEVP